MTVQNGPRNNIVRIIRNIKYIIVYFVQIHAHNAIIKFRLIITPYNVFFILLAKLKILFIKHNATNKEKCNL